MPYSLFMYPSVSWRILPSSCSVFLQGWACLYPYVRKQIVQVTTEDVLNLTHKEKVKFNELSDKAQAGLQEVGE